jgi:predicted secreted Zn-dependent protease
MQTARKTIAFYLLAASVIILSCGSATLTENLTAPPSSSTQSTEVKIEELEIPNTAIVYYDIKGSTENELRDQLNKLGPTGYDGYKGDATTEWYIRWNWPGYGSDSCDLGAAIISHDIKVILPRWTPPVNTSRDLRAKWATYVTQLALHEKGHVEHVLENFPAVVEAIKGGTCESADIIGLDMLDQLRQHDIDYDAVTHHGATQGARFP